MIYFACAIIFIWLSVTLFLCGRNMNLLRLTLNNLTPGVNIGGPEYDSVRKVMGYPIKPELLNAEGQKHLRKLNQNGWLFGAWMLLGFLLSVWLSPYFMAQ
jgi:hypothetical protein